MPLAIATTTKAKMTIKLTPNVRILHILAFPLPDLSNFLYKSLAPIKDMIKGKTIIRNIIGFMLVYNRHIIYSSAKIMICMQCVSLP